MDRAKLELIISKGVDFEIKDILTRGWETFKVNPIMHVGYTFLLMFVQFLFTFFLEDYIFIFTIFLAPALVTGFYLIANRISQQEFFDFPDYFHGFRYWLAVIIVNLISSILVVLGIFLFVLPAIYLLVSYMFCLLFTVFGGFEFWTSMELSRRLVSTNWFKFFLFGLVLLLINLAGILTLGVGLLITIPWSYFSVYVLFEELTEDAVVVNSASGDDHS